jgi:hypothetical protein
VSENDSTWSMWDIELNVMKRKAVWHIMGGESMWQVRRKVLMDLFPVIIVNMGCRTECKEEKRFIEDDMVVKVGNERKKRNK